MQRVVTWFPVFYVLPYTNFFVFTCFTHKIVLHFCCNKHNMDVVDISPSKKNPRGKIIDTGQKQIIIRLYKDKLKQQYENPDIPRLSYRKTVIEISKASGIGQRTITTTLSEYKTRGTVSSPSKKKNRSTVIEKVDDFDKSAIRQKVHGFWFNRQIPTFMDILTAVNEDKTLPSFKRSSFRKVIKDLNFVYFRKSGNNALLEREDIVNLRRSYLDRIRHYRQQNRPIYYLGETWVNTGEATSQSWADQTANSSRDAILKGLTHGQKEPSGKAERLVVLHIGSTNGFVPGGFLYFKTNSTDKHDEMNDTFYQWFVKTLPLLEENAVIVMDNASHHSVKKYRIPDMSWKKQDIINWLENKGEIIDKLMVKAQLLEKVKLLKPLYDKYVIDEYANDHNKIILRLPPYHCELNPMELAWSSVKHYVRMNNSTFKLQNLQELLISGVEHVTTDMWKNFVEHVVNEEIKYWELDMITDQILDKETEEEEGRRVLMIGTGGTDSDSDSDF